MNKKSKWERRSKGAVLLGVGLSAGALGTVGSSNVARAEGGVSANSQGQQNRNKNGQNNETQIIY